MSKTKQAIINDLTIELRKAKEELAESQSRKATIAEEKQKLEEQLEYAKTKHEDLYKRYLVERLWVRGTNKAMEYYAGVARDWLIDTVDRGAKRAEHDEEYAIVRELIHTGKPLDAENLRVMCEKHPKAELRRMVTIAYELGLELKTDLKTKEGVPLTQEEMVSRLYNVKMWVMEEKKK